ATNRAGPAGPTGRHGGARAGVRGGDRDLRGHPDRGRVPGPGPVLPGRRRPDPHRRGHPRPARPPPRRSRAGRRDRDHGRPRRLGHRDRRAGPALGDGTRPEQFQRVHGHRGAGGLRRERQRDRGRTRHLPGARLPVRGQRDRAVGVPEPGRDHPVEVRPQQHGGERGRGLADPGHRFRLHRQRDGRRLRERPAHPDHHPVRHVRRVRRGHRPRQRDRARHHGDPPHGRIPRHRRRQRHPVHRQPDRHPDHRHRHPGVRAVQRLPGQRRRRHRHRRPRVRDRAAGGQHLRPERERDHRDRAADGGAAGQPGGPEPRLGDQPARRGRPRRQHRAGQRPLPAVRGGRLHL
ncbi:MAG: FIG00485738: hypothetical protein, partial [uncultured Corynebacteriales bacterium]